MGLCLPRQMGFHQARGKDSEPLWSTMPSRGRPMASWLWPQGMSQSLSRCPCLKHTWVSLQKAIGRPVWSSSATNMPLGVGFLLLTSSFSITSKSKWLCVHQVLKTCLQLWNFSLKLCGLSWFLSFWWQVMALKKSNYKDSFGDGVIEEVAKRKCGGEAGWLPHVLLRHALDLKPKMEVCVCSCLIAQEQEKHWHVDGDVAI